MKPSSTPARKIPPAPPAGADYWNADGWHIYRRPGTLDMLKLARLGNREVYLFTHSTFLYALSVCRLADLGFDEKSIFSLGRILNCRKGLCPEAILIENKPATDENTQLNMEALGIPADNVWLIPTYAPPDFTSARLFLTGLSWRLAR